jgi:hypothetical protein
MGADLHFSIRLSSCHFFVVPGMGMMRTAVEGWHHDKFPERAVGSILQLMSCTVVYTRLYLSAGIGAQ